MSTQVGSGSSPVSCNSVLGNGSKSRGAPNIPNEVRDTRAKHGADAAADAQLCEAKVMCNSVLGNGSIIYRKGEYLWQKQRKRIFLLMKDLKN